MNVGRVGDIGLRVRVGDSWLRVRGWWRPTGTDADEAGAWFRLLPGLRSRGVARGREISAEESSGIVRMLVKTRVLSV
jgi:hypothetical protein